jgi:hypothetical protein
MYMSLAEMKQKVIEKITTIEDEKTISQISQLLENVPLRPRIEQVYQEIKAQYGNTLKRLAE